MPDPTTDPIIMNADPAVNQTGPTGPGSSPRPTPSSRTAAPLDAPATADAPLPADAPADAPAEPERSERFKIREARLQAIREAKGVNTVRVRPAREEHRQLLKHPSGGGFRSSGSVEWPNNTFTKRRIRDGDVIVEDREPGMNQQPTPTAGVQATQVPQSGGSGRTVNAAADSRAAAKQG